MFIKTLLVKNLRGFEDETEPIELRTPDGNPGSGLNIFVGENGTCKTTLLECLSYLTEASYFLQSRFTNHDFNDLTKPVVIEAKFDENFKYKLPESWRGSYVNADGFRLEVKTRENKTPGKLLSSPIQATGIVTTQDKKATTPAGSESSAVLDDFLLSFDPERLVKEINIFYFDRFRSRQISGKSTYKTTFERVIEDLNWKFLKKVKETTGKENDLNQKFSNEFFKAIIESAQEGAGTKIANDVKEFFNREEYKNIRIDFMNLLWPFSDSFFALRKEDTLTQIPINKLGAGIELIFSLLFLKSISSVSKGTIIYLIDEPEMSLHPQAQRKLLNILLEDSKEKQVFISTHSSHFIDPTLIDNVFKFEKNEKIKILPTSKQRKELADLKKDFVNLEVREVFFTNKVICVEGKVDLSRLAKFNSEFLNTTIVKMNGKEEAKKFHKLLKTFCPDFKILLDLDALRGKQKNNQGTETNPNTFKNWLDDIQTQVITLGKYNKEELLDINLSDKEKKNKHKIIADLSKENVIILSFGDIDDYLDEIGNITGNNQTEKKKELNTLLN